MTVHIGVMNVIDVMRFGIVGTNLQRTAIIKNVIRHIGIRNV